MLFYSVNENKKEKRFGNWFPIALSLWGFTVSAFIIFLGGSHRDKIEFYFFQGRKGFSNNLLYSIMKLMLA